MRHSTDAIPGLGACAVRWLARMLVDGGAPAVYTYLFAHAPTIPGLVWDTKGVFSLHTAEIKFVFGTSPPYGVVADETALAQQMAAYWYSFASSASGNPNPTSQDHVTWPKFTTEDDSVLRLDQPSAGGITVQRGLRKAACDWQTQQAIADPRWHVPGLNPRTQPSTRCKAALELLCASARRSSAGNCFICCGQHQYDLRTAGCQQVDLDNYCQHS